MIEIERKYLVKNNDFLKQYVVKNHISQGYICALPERTVRIRTKGNKGYLTIKGGSSDSNTTRFEWEKEIDLTEAQKLLALCEKGIIQKTRYEIPAGKHLIEVDVFEGENNGLLIAEIELENENDTIIKPTWLGEEVTSDARYFNAYLSKHPFLTW